MSNSPLVEYLRFSPNHSGKRLCAINRITPHCVVGQCSIEALGALFSDPKYRLSSNYGIDVTGKIGMFVEEENRSWCSSSGANDNRAVTIECASDTNAPYKMNDAVYNSLVKLCVDICKRNGKTKLLWIEDKGKALSYVPAENEMLLTVHRWFANKACPGEWLFSRLGRLAEEVNTSLSGQPEKPADGEFSPFLVRIITLGVIVRDGAGVNRKKTGECPPGVYTIVDEKADKNGTLWYKLKSGMGWICSDYADKL